MGDAGARARESERSWLAHTYAYDVHAAVIGVEVWRLTLLSSTARDLKTSKVYLQEALNLLRYHI